MSRSFALATKLATLVLLLALPVRGDSGEPAETAEVGESEWEGSGLWERFPWCDGRLEKVSVLWEGSGFPSGRSGSGGVVLAHRRAQRVHGGSIQPQSYFRLKGGGMRVSEAPVTEGLFLGGEIGGSVENVLDIGLSVDYFYRSTKNVAVLAQSEFEQLPVRVVATLDESAAHLVPVGVTLRVRIPIFGERFLPFVSGTGAYETLFLDNVGNPNSPDPVQQLLQEDETFSGFGWQLAAGMDLRLSPTVGIFGELGYHDSSPAQDVLLNGQPAELRVDMGGPFLRGGLRLGM